MEAAAMEKHRASPWIRGLLRKGAGDPDRVQQQIIADDAEALEGALHGQAGGFQDIDAVDLEGVGGAYGPGYGALADALG